MEHPDSRKLASDIIKIHTEDPLIRISPGVTNPEVSIKIRLVLQGLSQQYRIEIAKIIAETYSIRELSKNISDYEIEGEDGRYEIACVSAQNNGRRTARTIDRFGINNLQYRLNIARIAIRQDSIGVSQYIKNFGIIDQVELGNLFALALLNDANSISYIHYYFPNIGTLREDAPIDEVESWIKHQPDDSRLPKESRCIYSDIRRRDAGIKLLSGMIGKTNFSGLSGIQISRKALENITGFRAENFIGEYSSDSKGDFYEIVLELQAKCPVPCFSMINIDTELMGKAETFKKLIDFIAILNNIMQISTGMQYYTVIDELRDILEADKTVDTCINLTCLNIDLATKRLTDIFFTRLRILLGDKQENIRLLLSLQDLWGDISEVLTFIARLAGKSSWKKEIPIILNCIGNIVNHTFYEYKYQGDASIDGDTCLAKEQLASLSNSQTDIWKENPYMIEVMSSESTQEQDRLRNCLCELQTRIICPGNYNIEIPSVSSDDPIITITDKTLQQRLKSMYGNDLKSMLSYCLANLIRSPSLDSFKKTLSKIKSIQDFLRLNKDTKDTLLEISKLAYIPNKRAIVLTTVTDDPYALMHMGNMVKTHSCHNIRSGTHIQTVPSYILDANIKVIMGFIINPSNELINRDFEELCNMVSASPGDCTVTIDYSKQSLTISTKGQKTFNLKVGHAHFRRVIKIGKATENRPGIILEPEVEQTHPHIGTIHSHCTSIIDSIVRRMDCTNNVPIMMAKTRNPCGTYSDIAVGIKEYEYLLPSQRTV